MELDELEKVIRARHSVRAWQDKPVDEKLLLKAIELATWAPNGGNQQNWRFYLVTNQGTIREIADAVQGRAEQIASWPEAANHMDVERVRGRASSFREVPAAIAVAASRYQSPIDAILEDREGKDPEAARIRGWRNNADSRIQSVSSAIAYLLLVLHQMGLGAVWMTGPMQAKEDIEKILKVPDNLDVVAFIPVGYPAGPAPATRERKPVSEVCEVVR